MVNLETLENLIWYDGNNNTEIKAQSGKNTKLQLIIDQSGSKGAISGLYPIFGWGFIQGDGSNGIEKTVSFPIAFDSQPVIVIANYAGACSGSDPTDPGDLSTNANDSAAKQISVGVYNTGTLGFKVNMSRQSDTFGATGRYGFTYVAIGKYTPT